MYILEDFDMNLFETLFILLNNLLLIYRWGFVHLKLILGHCLLCRLIWYIHIFFSYSYSRRYVLKHISDFYSLLPQGIRVFSYMENPIPCRFLTLIKEKFSD